MTSSLDELLNAEFKEAFDEFDKVKRDPNFFFPQITFDRVPKIRALEIFSVFYLLSYISVPVNCPVE